METQGVPVCWRSLCVYASLRIRILHTGLLGTCTRHIPRSLLRDTCTPCTHARNTLKVGMAQGLSHLDPLTSPSCPTHVLTHSRCHRATRQGGRKREKGKEEERDGWQGEGENEEERVGNVPMRY